MRGREPVAPARVDRAGVRGRGLSRLTRSGGVGAPLGGTRTSRQELADGGPLARPRLDGFGPNKGRALRASGRHVRPPEARPDRRESAGRRAERRHASRKKDACSKGLSRRSVRRPPLFSERAFCKSSDALARRENDGACLDD